MGTEDAATAVASTSVHDYRRSLLQQAHDQDDSEKMTFSRKIAIYLAGKYKWYNPALEEQNQGQEEDTNDGASSDLQERLLTQSSGDIRDEKGSIERAWWYYEHIVLPR